ncbi:MAG: Nif3-like dinuclear metal center hexameric protein [Hespellia sp.]|nr:Nif3-like dinuclear metal center hexameric protein [Hespellia sp.]
MTCKDIINTIEEFYPRDAALDFDNVGLQAGRRDKEIRKIYLALDASDQVIEDAAAYGADMIITHHPLIFSPLKRVTDEDFISRRILRMIQKDICYYAMHTNYDVLRMAELSAQILEIEQSVVLEETTADKSQGIGRIGSFSEAMTLAACAEHVKKKLKLPNVKVFGCPDWTVRCAATSPGSGKSVIGSALEKGAQVLITGDIDHHEGMDAVARKLAIIDAGHYGTEYIFMEDMKQFLGEHLPEAEVEMAQMQIPYFIQ